MLLTRHHSTVRFLKFDGSFKIITYPIFHFFTSALQNILAFTAELLLCFHLWPLTSTNGFCTNWSKVLLRRKAREKTKNLVWVIFNSKSMQPYFINLESWAIAISSKIPFLPSRKIFGHDGNEIIQSWRIFWHEFSSWSTFSLSF